ncbi:MAG: Flagellar hook-length control protein FliK [uncultured Paraburkholderia sp.]|nr:MAG: Flagellar hook-length control protein FliK [uncultured Paraburkholderia sp.]CAH2939687.1 MAG: Flagellar hook-length control protein FliK [uncultured Paraburkholderia sp.]
MSDPTGKDKQPDSGVDIFNVKPAAKNTSEPGKAQAGAGQPKASALPSFVSKLGPVHFAIACAVVAAAWIGWPYVFSGSSSDKSTNAHMLNPYQAMTNASRDQQYQPVANQPATSPAVAAPSVTTATATPASDVTAAAPSSGASAAMKAVASAPAAASAAAAQPAQPTVKETELQAKVDDLQGKLATAEAQAAKCPAPVATASTNVSKPKHRVRHVSTSPRRYVSSTPTTSIGAGTTKPGDFTLNTVYRDQAWIQNSERTYVVQAGDVIDGMRIVRVDASTRQVVTSLGTIR